MGRIPKDSTLGDDEKGFQTLANKKAGVVPAPKAPPTTNSMQTALASLAKRPQRFADGGTASLMGDVPMGADPSMFDPDSAAQQLMSGPTPDLTPVAGAPASLDDLNWLTRIAMKGGTPPADAPQPAPMPPTPPATPPMPPTAPAVPNGIQQASQALQSTPDTNPGIYAGMTSADRLALQQKLMQQRNSPGAVLGNALAGIGDAANNAYGHGNSHFLQNNIENQAKTRAETLGGVDTAREQKLQDIQGPMAAQMADPKSPLALAMQKTLRSAGVNVPSGMPPSVMLQVAGPLGELAMKQATLSIQQQQVNATQANTEATRREEAAKGLSERPWYQKAAEMLPGVKSDATAEFQSELGKQAGKAPAKPAMPVMPQSMQQTKSGIKYSVIQ